jgi:formamidopyrimidine-DNA glycosylase
MPELPEVEITRRQISPKMVGRTIRRVRTTKPSYFFLTPPKELERRLTGRRIESLTRHGKYLIAVLDDTSRLFLHLGMTGQLFTASTRSVRLLSTTRGGALTPERQDAFAPDVHTHLSLGFEDANDDVLFRDVRKFGKVRWLPGGASDPRLDKLGPDALTVTGALLFAATRSRRTALKTVLLDQEVIAGVGNIYADEALFRAKIRPSRSARTLTRKEAELLAAEIRAVLLRSIETGGSSISDYVQPNGSDGQYQNERRVYARKGEPCYVCGSPIKRVVLAARSTHYCPKCQK